MNSNGTFVKTVVTVVSVLVVAGVIASVRLAFDSNEKFATIIVQIQGLKSDFDELAKDYDLLAKELENTKKTLGKVELLLEQVPDNHATLRAELADLKQEVRELKKKIP